jgi:acyl-homoserine lactone acylase PvdQ
VRDVFVEELCDPNGGTPTRATKYYLFKGRCQAMETFNAGLLGATPLIYNRTVHGSVFATATVGGKPYALSRRRSTFGRDGLNLEALKDMTEGRADTPNRFWTTANKFGFTFNWAWASRTGTAYFTSGYLPVRSRRLDRRLPTLGTGQYEWKKFLRRNRHPHGVSGPGGLLLNWNNRSAPGFMHGDDEPYGSAHRVEMFDDFPSAPQLTDVVGIMNRAATQDTRSPVWSVVSRVLAAGLAPNARDQQVVDIVDEWMSRDAPRVDADADTFFDEPGPVIMDALWRPIADAVMSPVFGSLIPALDAVRNLDGMEGQSFVDKDLRRLLGDPVIGPFNLSYCGSGSLGACSDALWQAVHQVADALTASQGEVDPALWRKLAATTGFVPGLLPNRFVSTNRPTFQQVLEFENVGS